MSKILEMLSEMIIVQETISSLITLFLFLSESTGKEKRKDKKKGIPLSSFILVSCLFSGSILEISSKSNKHLGFRWSEALGI